MDGTGKGKEAFAAPAIFGARKETHPESDDGSITFSVDSWGVSLSGGTPCLSGVGQSRRLVHWSRIHQ